MTTSNSPLSILQAQAYKIASTLKAAERGEKINVRFAEKIEAARDKATFKVGIVMDDKVITIDIPWATIKYMNEIDLSKYILNQMREAPYAR